MSLCFFPQRKIIIFIWHYFHFLKKPITFLIWLCCTNRDTNIHLTHVSDRLPLERLLLFDHIFLHSVRCYLNRARQRMKLVLSRPPTYYDPVIRKNTSQKLLVRYSIHLHVFMLQSIVWLSNYTYLMRLKSNIPHLNLLIAYSEYGPIQVKIIRKCCNKTVLYWDLSKSGLNWNIGVNVNVSPDLVDASSTDG